MSLRVRVTRELIELSEQRDPGNCAIANAVRLAHPDFACVRVEPDKKSGEILIKYSNRRTGERYCYEAPKTVRDQWLPVFDAEDKSAVPEIEFTARILAWVKPMKRVSPLARREATPLRAHSSRPLRPLPNPLRPSPKRA